MASYSLKPLLIRGVLRHYSRIQACSFCISTKSSAPFTTQFLPSFEKTSSPELDQLLNTIRDKIFAIKHLNNDQKRLIRDPTQRTRLDSDNFVIGIGGSDVRLQPFDFAKDGVSVQKSFQKALDLTEESGEWGIWPSLLRGSVSAQVTLQSQWFKKFVRKALDAGQVEMIVHLLQKEWSPISLAESEFRTNIMYAIRVAAEKSNWDIQITKESLKHANIVNRLARTKIHGDQQSGFPDPYMILVPLELNARLAKATKDLNGLGEVVSSQDEEGKNGGLETILAPPADYEREAEKYIKRVFSVLEAEKDLSDSTRWGHSVAESPNFDSMWELARKVGYWSAVCMSLRSAQNLIPTVISIEQVQNYLGQIEPMIRIGVENLQKAKEQKLSPPPVALWEKYASEAQISA